MSSNAPWNNQFKTSSSATTVGQTENSSSWNHPVVNTPQTNPASWPQLGATVSEQLKQPTPVTSQSEELTQQVFNLNSDMNNTTSNSETNSSAWGRVSDNSTKMSQSSTSTGWGTPSTGAAWGQNHSSGVDDGTAVWGKSTSAQQHQGNWGGPAHVTQRTESVTTAANWTEPTSSNNQEENSTANSQQSASITQISSSTQPVTWAKAASAGLPPNTTETEQTPADNANEPETTEPSTPPAPQPPVVETDPVQKLVNSHEGWGKKPIQQGTSWNISDPNQGLGRPSNNVSNGTEAWGKPSGGQMPPAPGWGESSAKKQPGNWGNNFNNPPTAPSGNWGAPTQQQQQPRPSFVPGNASNASGWGNPPQQQQQSGMNNSRWGDVSGQSSTNSSGWGGPQNLSGNPSWGGGGVAPNNDSNPSSGWGNAPPSRPAPQNTGWGNNMMPQSSNTDPSTWGRATDPRRPNTVNDGTAAWGNPGAYSKVNLWDHNKTGISNPDNVSGQLPNVNSQVEAKGWGTLPNQPPNRLPSPKGWGDSSPTQPNMAGDNGSSGWGMKNMSGEKWDKGNGPRNWNVAKPSAGGWGHPNDQQWNSPDNASNWGTQMGKNDNMVKNNMDYGPRGGLPPQQTVNQQMMMRNNQMPPVLPPQLQNQFHQIRHAVMNGLLPNHILSPQMTPQHMQNIIQFLNKTNEFQKMQMKMAMLIENKAIPQIQRQQQIEQFTRALRQCQQQIEAQKAIIIQNAQQPNLNKSQPNMGNKMNGPTGRLDLTGVRSGPGGQSMVSPLNNMNPLSQALPLPTMASPREQKSRFMNMHKRPNNFGPMGDNPQQLNPSNMGLGIGPGGDTGFNGMPFRSNLDEFVLPDNGGMLPSALPTMDPSSTQPIASNDPSVALADIGPPEFTPGVPWKGFRHIDPETDPNITPGSVASAKSMSVNTVRDADQVLSRDRSAQADPSSTDGPEDAAASLVRAQQNFSESNPSQIWSVAPTNSAAATQSEMWKGSNQSSEFRSPKDLAPSWGEQQFPGGSWDQQSQPMPGGSQNPNRAPANQDSKGSWLVLTNFNKQVDPALIQNMCAQHGTLLSFQPHCPMEGTALVKFRSPDEAISAKKALNMCMVGSTMLVATVATDRDVNNFMTATSGGGGSWASTSTSGNRFISSSGSTGGIMTQPPPPQPNMAAPTDMGGMVSQFWGNTVTNNVLSGASWPTNASPNVAWSGATGEDLSRIMSPIHNLLPENLLGGETL